MRVAEPQPENMVKEIAKREGRDPIEYLYDHFLTREGRGATYQCGIGYGVNTPYGANTLDGACVLSAYHLACEVSSTAVRFPSSWMSLTAA